MRSSAKSPAGGPARGHLTPVDLDALELDLAAPAERERLLAHAGACPTCAARREQHGLHARRFADEVFRRTAAAVAVRTARARRGFGARHLGWAAPALAGAAALGLWLRPPPERPAAPEAATAAPGAPAIAPVELARKGAGSLQVFARRDQQIFPVSDGAVLAPGDAIRFFVDPPGLGHVIIGSVDGAGKATIYHPYGGAESAAVDPGRRFEVPGSIILDAAAGPERIFAVFSHRPLASADVRRTLAAIGAGGPWAIRQTETLPLAGTIQVSVRFEKGELTP